MKTICLLSVLFFFSVLPGPAENLFFRSNELGMTIEKIDKYRRNDFSYVVEIQEQAEVTVKILYKDGEETKRWRLIRKDDGRREYTYTGEELESVVDYYPDGRVDEIEYYEKDALIEHHIYKYTGGEIRYVLVENGEGEELYRNVYKRDDSGRLIKVVRQFPDKNDFVSLYTFGSSGVAAEWHGTADEGHMFRFRDAERPLSKEEWEGIELAQEEEFQYQEESLTMSVYKNYNTGVIERTWYNEEGRKQRVLKRKGSSFVEEQLFEYNERGEPAVRYKRTPEKREKWEFMYDENGEQIAELYYKKNRLISKKEFVSEDETYEYLYRNGEPFIKIHYKNDQKVGEELLIDTPQDTLY
jgi:hypothetical protein